MINKFSENTKQVLKYYVYALVNPTTNKIFYIGKGTGDRIFEHEKKLDSLEITEIVRSNLEVKKIIIHSGLDEESALSSETSLISVLKFLGENLINKVEGKHFKEICCDAYIHENRNNKEELSLSSFADRTVFINLYNLNKKEIHNEDIVISNILSKVRISLEKEKPKVVVACYKGMIIGSFLINEFISSHENYRNKQKVFNRISKLERSNNHKELIMKNVKNIFKEYSKAKIKYNY